ncbi:hypothetical protein EDD91_7240 [Streptomyces sp. KS 21]|nr:hypothetical protein EDD91_7240 [Streptomyces sp. KS 21]
MPRETRMVSPGDPARLIGREEGHERSAAAPVTPGQARQWLGRSIDHVRGHTLPLPGHSSGEVGLLVAYRGERVLRRHDRVPAAVGGSTRLLNMRAYQVSVLPRTVPPRTSVRRRFLRTVSRSCLGHGDPTTTPRTTVPRTATGRTSDCSGGLRSRPAHSRTLGECPVDAGRVRGLLLALAGGDAHPPRWKGGLTLRAAHHCHGAAAGGVCAWTPESRSLYCSTAQPRCGCGRRNRNGMGGSGTP